MIKNFIIKFYKYYLNKHHELGRVCLQKSMRGDWSLSYTGMFFEIEGEFAYSLCKNFNVDYYNFHNGDLQLLNAFWVKETV